MINRLAEIVLPAGFGAEPRSKDLDSQSQEQTVQWTVTVPVNKTPLSFINIEARGRDASNPNVEVVAEPDSLGFVVVERAELNLAAAITDPESATDRILTIGQNFTVTADLQVDGEAAVIGEDLLRITLPEGYGTAEPLEKTTTPGVPAKWLIRAPNDPTPIQELTVEVVDRNANDENTNLPPPLTPNPPRVFIPVQTQAIGLNLAVLTDRKPTTVARGATEVPMFGLRFNNTSDAQIDVENVTLHLRDKDGNELAPNSVFSKLSVVDYRNSNTVFEQVSPMPANNPISIDFDPVLSVASSQQRSIEFTVDLSPQTEVKNFQFSIDSPRNDIVAKDVSSDTLVTIRDDSSGLTLVNAITPGLSVLFDANLEASFFNFPNPFGNNGHPTTKFNYSLEQDSEVTIRIYTLLGELVKTFSFTANDPEGKAGTHDGTIVWDGTNDKGQDVLNGVYVAVLVTDNGKATTKIAIAK